MSERGGFLTVTDGIPRWLSGSAVGAIIGAAVWIGSFYAGESFDHARIMDVSATQQKVVSKQIKLTATVGNLEILQNNLVVQVNKNSTQRGIDEQTIAGIQATLQQILYAVRHPHQPSGGDNE